MPRAPTTPERTEFVGRSQAEPREVVLVQSWQLALRHLAESLHAVRIGMPADPATDDGRRVLQRQSVPHGPVDRLDDPVDAATSEQARLAERLPNRPVVPPGPLAGPNEDILQQPVSPTLVDRDRRLDVLRLIHFHEGNRHAVLEAPGAASSDVESPEPVGPGLPTSDEYSGRSAGKR